MTERASETKFDPQRYWESRLSERYTLGATGWSGLGESFNRWSYAVRRVVFSRIVREVLSDRGSLRVLDVGSGTGFYLRAWQRLGVADVAGSDLTAAAVARLGARFPGMPVHQLDIGEEDAQPPGAPFDAISVIDVLYHIVDDDRYEQALRNCARLLKRGGTLILSENFVAARQPGQHQVSRTADVIEAILARADLVPVLMRPVFFLMNTPVDSASRLLRAWWKVAMKLASRNEAIGWALGAGLYPVEVALATFLRDGPSTKIMVCRRR
jgi:2-polyprenyl-3-methyl-5-hydroxy-6-metoxy-1,4-benzoquinol methylase